MSEITMPSCLTRWTRARPHWLIDDGAEVHIGDELVEIETDKATMTYQSAAEGTLEVVVAEGPPWRSAR